MPPRIAHVRALVVRGGGADYHDQRGAHWIDDHIATPMARYPEYRQSRRSFGIDVLGTLVVEVEADDGTVGFAVTAGGEPAAWVVEHHLARFLEGASAEDVERIWDQMYLSTIFYGRRGVVLNAISGVDLAVWDLLGRLRDEPVHALIGPAVRDEIVFYATGPRPDLAHKLGFIGGKLPLHHAPDKGADGLARNLEQLSTMRARVGDDFWLMWDCWMSLDVEYAAHLVGEAADLGLKWLEEPLLPDDYWGHGELRRRMPAATLLAAGEHEATRWGFRLLAEMGQVDILQPDVGWCGGLTELLRVSAFAEGHDKLVVPHGSSVYSYHFAVTSRTTPFSEFIMMHPEAREIVPMFSPLLTGEPLPESGRLRTSALDRPGFGVELDEGTRLDRPFPH
ncbi:MAG TPA: L-rhamnonate dehydratase [Acidimicrobiales bacterium]|nr:L-rhamnonate dehydratase [Acidimicrobiales bacterium]